MKNEKRRFFSKEIIKFRLLEVGLILLIVATSFFVPTLRNIEMVQDEKLKEVAKTFPQSSIADNSEGFSNDLEAAKKKRIQKKGIDTGSAIQIRNYNANDPTSEKKVYLTFDDGPTSNTNTLLNILDKYNVKVTFFMLGPNMSKYPEIVKRMLESGHSIGLHGITHSLNYFYKDETSPLNEMNECNNILENITGKRSNLVRTPYGSIPALKVAQQKKLTEAGYRIWDWTVDSRDAIMKDPTSDKIVSSTINSALKQRQPIILMHDRKLSISALERIVDYLVDHDYKFGTL